MCYIRVPKPTSGHTQDKGWGQEKQPILSPGAKIKAGVPRPGFYRRFNQLHQFFTSNGTSIVWNAWSTEMPRRCTDRPAPSVISIT